MAATMRVIGPVESRRGLGLRDHLCRVHENPADGPGQPVDPEDVVRSYAAATEEAGR